MEAESMSLWQLPGQIILDQKLTPTVLADRAANQDRVHGRLDGRLLPAIGTSEVAFLEVYGFFVGHGGFRRPKVRQPSARS